MIELNEMDFREQSRSESEEKNSPETVVACGRSGDTKIVKVTKAFLILACVLNGIAFLPTLLWCVPMACFYFSRSSSTGKIGLGFKVCTLIFVGMVAGILMLCDDEH